MLAVIIKRTYGPIVTVFMSENVFAIDASLDSIVTLVGMGLIDGIDYVVIVDSYGNESRKTNFKNTSR